MSIEVNIPSLSGGVSQQAEQLRFPAQVEEILDAIPSVVRGLAKRPNTRHVDVLDASPRTDLSTFYHDITASDNSRYLLDIVDGDLKVYDAKTLAEKSVDFPEGKDYLNIEGKAAEQFEALTVADTTFVLNRESVVAEDSSISSPLNREGIIFIKQGAYGTNYSVRVQLGEAGAQATPNYTVSVNEAYGSNPTRYRVVGSGVSDGGSDYVDTPDIYLEAGDGTLLPFVLDGVMQSGQISVGAHGTYYINPSSTYSITLDGNGAVDTFTVDIPSSYYYYEVNKLSIVSPIVGLVFSPPASGGGGGIYTATYKTHETDAGEIGTRQIAAQLTNLLSSELPSQFDVTSEGSNIRITNSNSLEYWELTTSDDVADSYMAAIRSKVNSITDLPASCWQDFKIAITGNNDESDDDYYVQFQTHSGAPYGSGSWVETSGDNVKTTIDRLTMPHVLEREADGTFTFRPRYWGTRVVGDEDTNPYPSFVGEKLTTMCFSNKRLGFATGSTLIFSETDQPFNFFRTTVISSLATRPVDIDVVAADSIAIEHMLPQDSDILLFGSQAQMVLDLSRGFEFDLVSLSQPTSTTAIGSVAPQSMEGDTLFCFPRAGGFGLGQFSIEPETLKLRDFDLAEQAPTYLKGNPKQIIPYGSDNMAFIRSDGLANGVYFYRYLDRNRERVQSAYGKLTFGDSARVDFGYTIDDEVYLVVTRPTGGTSVEHFNPSSVGLTSEATGIATLLDRRIDETQLASLSYDAGNNETVIGLPFIPEVDEEYELVPKDTPIDDPSIAILVSQVGSTLRFSGDFTSTPFYVGRKYVAKTELTKPVFRAGGDKAVSGGKFQVLYGRISVNDSYPFKAVVELQGREPYTHEMTKESVFRNSLPVDADYRFPVYGRGDDVKVTLSNDTPFTSNWLSLAWEGRFNKRRRQA